MLPEAGDKIIPFFYNPSSIQNSLCQFQHTYSDFRAKRTPTCDLIMCVICTAAVVCVDTELPARMVGLDGSIVDKVRETATFGCILSCGRFITFAGLTNCAMLTFWLLCTKLWAAKRPTAILFSSVFTKRILSHRSSSCTYHDALECVEEEDSECRPAVAEFDLNRLAENCLKIMLTLGTFLQQERLISEYWANFSWTHL